VTGPTEVESNSGVLTGTPVVDPGAGATIASTIVGGGFYQVDWTVEIQTAAATVPNNFALQVNGVTQETSVNGTAVGVYPQNPRLIFVNGIATVAIVAIAADATGTYDAQGTITQVLNTGTPFNLKLGKRSWNLLLPPTGILVIAPVQIPLDRDADRYLTGSVAGDWSFELMGYADTGRRGRI
jgi:hypothetical protein